MRGKRELFARLCSATGFTALFEQLRKRPSLIVLNYHRIGNVVDTLYDPGVFSATAAEFRRQLDYLARHFEICTLAEAIAMVRDDGPRQSKVLLTFDDGYRDNYEIAFPILRVVGVPATFFLPTAFIDSRGLPWWDAIAYIVKNAKRNVVCLSYPRPLKFEIGALGCDAVIANVLRAYKDPEMKDHERFIDELTASCDSSLPDHKGQSCFLTWEQARAMLAAGMDFGSHTHSHEVLSKLPAERQYEELSGSRRILERELKCPIQALAYPVGSHAAFSNETREMARRVGYLAAFSFYGGFNLTGAIDPYDVQRFAVERQSHPRFRLQMALGGVSGTVWV